MMGVGGDDSWGATAHEPYLIRPGKENAIEYGFTLVPFDKKEDYLKFAANPFARTNLIVTRA